MAAAMMISLAVCMWIMSSDWFLNLVNTGGRRVAPVALITTGPVLVLVLGFVVIVSALCGAFNRKI